MPPLMSAPSFPSTIAAGFLSGGGSSLARCQWRCPPPASGLRATYAGLGATNLMELGRPSAAIAAAPPKPNGINCPARKSYCVGRRGGIISPRSRHRAGHPLASQTRRRSREPVGYIDHRPTPRPTRWGPAPAIDVLIFDDRLRGLSGIELTGRGGCPLTGGRRRSSCPQVMTRGCGLAAPPPGDR